MLNTKSLEFYQKLVHSGAKESLAQSIVEVIEQSSHLGLDALATKEHLKELRLELKEDINTLRYELKDEINRLRYEMKEMIAAINSNFRIIFIIGVIVSAILVIPVLSSWLQPVIQRLLNH
jgi:histidinol phosphatase-like PHP family hydrolase